MVADNPVDIVVAHVGQCNIVSLQEGQTRIVILKIQGGTHSRRHLVDKTENTLVAAGTVVAHQTIFKFYAKVIIILFLDLQKPFFPIRLADQHFYILILDHVTIIKNVLYFLVVYS